MGSGGKKSKPLIGKGGIIDSPYLSKKGTLLDQTKNVVQAQADLVTGKLAKNEIQRQLLDVTGVNDNNKKLQNLSNAQASAINDQTKAIELANKNNEIQQNKDRQAVQDQEAELQAQLAKDENRKSARARQLARSRGQQGRQSTILANSSIGASLTSPKTLLGQ